MLGDEGARSAAAPVARGRSQDGGRRADRGLFGVGLAVLILIWVLQVYVPERRRLRAAYERRAELIEQIRGLASDVGRLSKAEHWLQAGDRYLWERVIRTKLNWLAPGEHSLDRSVQHPMVPNAEP